MSAPAPIRIEDALGVCGVRDDTRLLAEASAQRETPGRALDLGTGSGYVAIYLAQRGWQVDAVDVSPRALALAQRNADLNGVAPRIFASHLFDAVVGAYDVIACNPPQRADETEGSRVLTAALRRVPWLANLLMRLTQPFLERRRLGFLAEIARNALPHLAEDGRLLLVISAWEAAETALRVLAQRLAASLPVSSIPGLDIVTFCRA